MNNCVARVLEWRLIIVHLPIRSWFSNQMNLNQPPSQDPSRKRGVIKDIQVSTNKENDLKTGDRVAYVPYHANGDLNHPDIEIGTISSMKDVSKTILPHFTYFVRFDETVARLGWEGTTGQGCKRDQLVKLGLYNASTS